MHDAYISQQENLLSGIIEANDPGKRTNLATKFPDSLSFCNAHFVDLQGCELVAVAFFARNYNKIL